MASMSKPTRSSARGVSWCAVMVLAALVLGACTPTSSTPRTASGFPEYEAFLRAYRSGADCGRLHELRNAVSPKDLLHLEEMNAALAAVGCLSSAGTRQPPRAPVTTTQVVASTATPAPVNYVSNYRISFKLSCTPSQAERLFSEAGTRDPRRAADYLSAIFKPGLERQGSADGCYDALTGAPNKFPE